MSCAQAKACPASGTAKTFDKSRNMFAALPAVFGTGRHRPNGRRAREVIPKPKTVEMVDASTLRAHLLSTDADHRDGGAGLPYVAICGQEVRPAAMVEPGRGYCQSCIPTRETW